MRILLSLGVFAITAIGLVTLATEKDANDLVREKLNVQKRDTTKIYNLIAYKRNSKTPVEVDTSRYCIAYWTYPNTHARVSIFKDTKHPIFYYNFVSSEPSVGNTNSSIVRLQYKYLERHRCSGKNVLRYEFPPAGVVLPKTETNTPQASKSTTQSKSATKRTSAISGKYNLNYWQSLANKNKSQKSIFFKKHEWERLQTHLITLGYPSTFYVGIRAWQRKNGYKGNGRVTSSQLMKLVRQTIDRNGRSIKGPTASVKHKVPKQILNMSNSDWARVQQQLSLLGYSTGGVDGIVGANTIAAIKAFQNANGRKPDGVLKQIENTILFGD